MIELSPAARERIRALFSKEDVAQAERLLSGCPDNTPLISDVKRQGVDRIVFAMIRLSSGSLDRLESAAIPLFRRDWRDLLVAADFAEDIHAHEKWHPRALDTAMQRQWREGVRLEGVKFGPGAVVLWPAEEGGALGTVVGLLGLEPEPRYKVRWKTGLEHEMWQRQLRNAG